MTCPFFIRGNDFTDICVHNRKQHERPNSSTTLGRQWLFQTTTLSLSFGQFAHSWQDMIRKRPRYDVIHTICLYFPKARRKERFCYMPVASSDTAWRCDMSTLTPAVNRGKHRPSFHTNWSNVSTSDLHRSIALDEHLRLVLHIRRRINIWPCYFMSNLTSASR